MCRRAPTVDRRSPRSVPRRLAPARTGARARSGGSRARPAARRSRSARPKGSSRWSPTRRPARFSASTSSGPRRPRSSTSSRSGVPSRPRSRRSSTRSTPTQLCPRPPWRRPSPRSARRFTSSRQPRGSRERNPEPTAGNVWPWMAAGVAVLTFVAFAPSLLNLFVDWDDPENFLANPSYRGLGWTELKWMWTTFLLGHWVPASWMTLGLDYVVWGMNPVGYHLTNVLLHSANAAVFYLLALRLLRAAMAPADPSERLAGRLGAALAALIFAVHPLRVESVAWVTERRDVLSGLFYLLTVWAYLRDAEVGSEEN